MSHHGGNMLEILIMWLPVIIPLTIELANAETKLTKIKHGNLFKDVGHVYSQAKDAHLIIPININELEQRRDTLAAIRESVGNIDENKKIPSNDNTQNKYLFNRKTRKSLNWMKQWTNTSITNGMDRIEDALKSFEREHILKTIKKYNYNKDTAAKALNIGLSSLYRKMEELNIPTKTPKEGEPD